MQSEFILLIIIFFLVAIVYSSVGFGGGSSYLAFMSYFSISFLILRPTALLCNIVVVAGGTYIFYKQGALNFRKCLPFIIASIPMAFLGGYYKIGERSFFILLGLTLIGASILLWFQQSIQRLQKDHGTKSDSLMLNIGLGSGIGLLSGLVGIGGGIFLSPVLHLINWDKAKSISAMASFFILVNSVSGLAGQLSRSASIDWNFIWPLLLAVFAGGQIGSRLGARKFNPLVIKRITAVIILVAGVNTLLKYM
jgi:uncharacterized protein